VSDSSVLGTALAFPLGFSAGGTTCLLLSADPWAIDLIELQFNSYMNNNEDLQNPANYTITPVDDGQAVRVLGVRTGNRNQAWRVFLVVSPFTRGARYTVTASNSLANTNGVSLDTDNDTADFIGRKTKVDTFKEGRQHIYSLDTTSIYRNVLNGILRADEIIGGYRKYSI
jgi:hypothetical protein